MWLYHLKCEDCEFAATIFSGGPIQYYFCQTCREVIRIEEPRLQIQPLKCSQCQVDLMSENRLSPDSSGCPMCEEGSLDIASGGHLSVSFERSEPYEGQTIHGQVVEKGKFVQLAIFNEPSWRGRLKGQTPPVGIWVEAKVLEIAKKTLVCEFLRELPQELLLCLKDWNHLK